MGPVLDHAAWEAGRGRREHVTRLAASRTLALGAWTAYRLLVYYLPPGRRTPPDVSSRNRALLKAELGQLSRCGDCGHHVSPPDRLGRHAEA